MAKASYPLSPGNPNPSMDDDAGEALPPPDPSPAAVAGGPSTRDMAVSPTSPRSVSRATPSPRGWASGSTSRARPSPWGYQRAIYFYPDGKNREDNSTYISLFIALASEGTDVRPTLQDQSGEGNNKLVFMLVGGLGVSSSGSSVPPCSHRRARGAAAPGWLGLLTERAAVGVDQLSDKNIVFLRVTYSDMSYHGGLDFRCVHCGALFWFAERCLSESAITEGRVVYKLCCRGSKVKLPKFKAWPSPLRELAVFSGGPRCREFMRLIRSYNSMFAFTSLGANVDKSINIGGGPYVFKINGAVAHKIGSLLPAGGKDPQFAQLYIHDMERELDHRLKIFNPDGEPCSGPDRQIVVDLLDMLNQHNKLVKDFWIASQCLVSPECPEIAVRIVESGSSDPRVYSPPTAPELAALIVGL
ncbi:hypothetical protein ACQ4PT_053040 [Festuca glaucescens]